MTNPNLIMALGKVIIAAAWADGAIAHDEINSLKDLLFLMPDMTATQWAELEMYIEEPVAANERARLVAQLQDAIMSSEDRGMALLALQAMIRADGEVTPEEEQVAAEISAAIESAGTGLVGGLSRLFKGPIERRTEAAANAPNREIYFDDFVHNKVYYSIRRRLDLGTAQLGLPEDTLRKMSLAGGLMARIAHADGEVDPSEIGTIEHLLQTEWGVSRAEAAIVAEIALLDASRELDYHRLTRGFFAYSPEEDERLRFIDLLFKVAAADGMVTTLEIEEIRMIARSLKLSHKQFIDAKLKIPREKRAG